MPVSCGLIVPLPRDPSCAVGVGHPAISTKSFRLFDRSGFSTRSSPPDLKSRICGVGQPLSDEPEPLSDMRRADARSAQIRSPDGVARGFHVSVYKVEPAEAVLARNLLSKDDCRLALADEVVPMRPQVPLVSNPRSSACRAERLARTGSGPNRAVVGPSCEPEGEAPAADPREEVALSVSTQSSWVHVSDVRLIYVSIRDQAALDEFSQPRSRLRVDLVVVGSHATSPNCAALRPRRYQP
jgi:hypothetical protein